MHNFRRLVTRWEYHFRNFLGFVQLGCSRRRNSVPLQSSPKMVFTVKSDGLSLALACVKTRLKCLPTCICK